MATPEQLEIHRSLRGSQEKYTYFLLTAVGASLAFAVTQTREAVLSLTHIPLGLATLSWCLSFFFGCRNIAYVNSTLYANATLLSIRSGEHPQVGRDPEVARAAVEGVKAAIESNSNIANRLYHWQFRCFVVGVLLYIAWHVFEMWARAGSV